MNFDKIKSYIPEKAKIEYFGNTVSFEVAVSEIKEIAINLRHNKNLPLKLITATDDRAEQGCFKIWYIFGVPEEQAFLALFIKLKNTEDFPSLASVIYESINYERKIQTFFGLKPIGNPDSRPIILHENWPANVYPLRKDFAWQTKPEEAKGEYLFQKVDGEGIYEIPVGPIHAGIIEPGHFRFSMAGEEMVLLESRLGFVHKGSEKLFEVLPIEKKIELAEKISGDSSFSHSLAFCQALEQLSQTILPRRAEYLRVIFAELERLANHFGDIGAIMLDTGFNFGGANGARLREMVMQINEDLTGSRFLRGVNIYGGVTKDIAVDKKEELSKNLINIRKDFLEIIKIVTGSVSLLNRLKGTGKLTSLLAKTYAALGVAAKATGISLDARFDFPCAAYDELRLKNIEIENDGDVYARFMVRIKEVLASLELIEQALGKLPVGDINNKDIGALKKNAIAISIVEGWRGEIVYFVSTDSQGNISRVMPRDPSFINWSLLGEVIHQNIIPDFPLINKSF
ncbi:MAG: NADH-quinone oxidoreductase subunit C, partial [Patescibacteria group bacterium]